MLASAVADLDIAPPRGKVAVNTRSLGSWLSGKADQPGNYILRQSDDRPRHWYVEKAVSTDLAMTAAEKDAAEAAAIRKLLDAKGIDPESEYEVRYEGARPVSVRKFDPAVFVAEIEKERAERKTALGLDGIEEMSPADARATLDDAGLLFAQMHRRQIEALDGQQSLKPTADHAEDDDLREIIRRGKAARDAGDDDLADSFERTRQARLADLNAAKSEAAATPPAAPGGDAAMPVSDHPAGARRKGVA